MMVLRRIRERMDRDANRELVEETRHVLDEADQSTAAWRATANKSKHDAGVEVARQMILRQRLQSGEEFVISDLFPDTNGRGA